MNKRLKWLFSQKKSSTSSKIDYTDPKYQDPLEEVYAIRREISEQYGHDIHRLVEGLREWQREQEANGVKFNFAIFPLFAINLRWSKPISNRGN